MKMRARRMIINTDGTMMATIIVPLFGPVGASVWVLLSAIVMAREIARVTRERRCWQFGVEVLFELDRKYTWVSDTDYSGSMQFIGTAIIDRECAVPHTVLYMTRAPLSHPSRQSCS